MLYHQNIAKYTAEKIKLQWNIFATCFVYKCYNANKVFIWTWFYFKTFEYFIPFLPQELLRKSYTVDKDNYLGSSF